jgi:iron complex outermembrane receptor protein
MFSLTALQRIGRRVDLSFDLFAASEYDTPFFLTSGVSRIFRVGGPVKADLVGSYSIPVSDSKTVKLYGKIENVFDRAYFEDGFRSPGLWGVAGLRFQF